jgi:hypothetical protein
MNPLSQLLTEAKKLASSAIGVIAGPATVPGRAIQAATAVLTLIDQLRPLFDGKDGEDLEISRTELDTRIQAVNGRFDRTIDTLEGRD